MAAVAEPKAAGAEERGEETRRKVAIICSKGSLDMVYPGLILANAARMMGMDAMIFFTFWGLDIVTRNKAERLRLGLVGNPSVPLPTLLAGLPGVAALATKMMKRRIEELDLPSIPELLEILDDAGAELYACRMAMEMFGRSREELVPQVKDVIGAMDFFRKAEGAQVIFI